VTVHADVTRGVDADAHLIAPGLDHRDDDVVADHDPLAGAPRQDQHQPALIVLCFASASGAWIGQS
jgi:hypothetical protein